jgi:hypothetical protein
MINEVLFMEARLFGEFLHKFDIRPKDANRMFERFGIWEYIEECYDVLHMNGDEYILNDIESILKRRGAFA